MKRKITKLIKIFEKERETLVNIKAGYEKIIDQMDNDKNEIEKIEFTNAKQGMAVCEGKITVHNQIIHVLNGYLSELETSIEVTQKLVRKLIQESGIPALRLAKICKVHHDTITKIKDNKGIVRDDKIHKIYNKLTKYLDSRE